jgi:hypothetical protein
LLEGLDPTNSVRCFSKLFKAIIESQEVAVQIPLGTLIPHNNLITNNNLLIAKLLDTSDRGLAKYDCEKQMCIHWPIFNNCELWLFLPCKNYKIESYKKLGYGIKLQNIEHQFE